jgi:hypothetical protein
MDIAKSEASNAPIPSGVDHLLLREAERAKGIANTPKAETRTPKHQSVLVSEELDSVEVGSALTKVHFPNSLRRDATEFRQGCHGVLGNTVVD